MSKVLSLTENHEFRRLYYRGKCSSGRALAVYCLKNRRDENRLGITVGAKLGCAVARNRVRRRLRECYRALAPEMANGYDIVIVARGRAMESSYKQLADELRHAAKTLGLISPGASDSR